jgi:hypothetical protein
LRKLGPEEWNVKKIATVLVLLLSVATGFAQCNAKRVTARTEMHSASVVIVGTVTAAEPVGETWDFLDGVSYTVHVDSIIHGKTNRSEYEIFSENIPAAFDMAVGKHYVLYIQPQYDRYEINSCGNSHATEEVEASMGKLLAKGD